MGGGANAESGGRMWLEVAALASGRADLAQVVLKEKVEELKKRERNGAWAGSPNESPFFLVSKLY
jgi:hypothetical protein